MDETEKFKENVSQKDQRSLFHTMKKNDSADDTKKQFTGKAYGVWIYCITGLLSH